jgi:uncharacterized membrane protein
MATRHIVLFAATAAFILKAAPAFAWVEFAPHVHHTLVLLHIFGAIIFMGNLVVSAMWMNHARRTRDADVLYFASRLVIRADWVFTLPGFLMILVTGILALGPHGGFPNATWAELSLAVFILSGIIWTGVLVRLQRRMLQMSREAVELKLAVADRFYKVAARWMMWGGIATLLPFIALVLMVFKPKLWG